MSDDQRTAQEMLATADAIRRIRWLLVVMTQKDHVVTRCWPEVSIVLCEGLNTARSLEHLAGLLAEAGRIRS
jgi:hypothetical protein